ncbi:MAG: hypothetical protein WED05_12690 [Candidatus Atabeyarchaeum deiterrae]
MGVGTFVATPVGSTGKNFRIIMNTLDESATAIKEMAARVLALTGSTPTALIANAQGAASFELHIGLPRGYQGFAASCIDVSGENIILALAAKPTGMPLLSYAVEACRNKINVIIEGIKRDGKVPRDLLRDLHLSLERELGLFRL